ncbi:MAG: gamma-glutamyltransferase [Campylobacteraceae bacterium 4484_4]|nr:MAG: gamma-glutamyltransferase [Campylobacteraceae bacterium 4484_4]
MRGVIAAGDRWTAEAGAEILEKGGNAFDAACAAMLAAPLSEPMLTSLGGGGFMLTHQADGTAALYDFFVDVPPHRAKRPDFFPIYVDFGNAIQEFHVGAASIAVPGVVAGIDRIHREKGSLPMEEIIAPALRYAKEGITLSKLQAGFVKLLEPILLSTEESRELFAPQGSLIDQKRPFTNPEYGDFLERFAKEGAKLFYRGEIAESIDTLCRREHGSLRLEDLGEYEVIRRKPIAFSYAGEEILTNPPPSAGGILIAFALKLLDGGKVGTFGSLAHLREVIETMAVTADFRKEHINEFLHETGLERILENARLLSCYRLSKKSRLNLWGNTTHISVIDEAYNCASVTTTNGEGSGQIIPGTGIMLNNMLGEEDLNPHGFFQWPAGIRLPSMMAPTMVLQKGRPRLILGSAGSNRIRSAITETVMNHIVFGMPVQEAIDAPRIHYEKEELFIEPGFDSKVVEKVAERYKTNLFDTKSMFFGGVNAVTGAFNGGADTRRGGSVVIVE